MIYLASPFTHKNEMVERERYYAVLFATQKILRQNINVYSPIVHWYRQHRYYELPGDVEFYERHNHEMIEKCERFCILTLDGWLESRGIMSEIAHAISLGRLVELCDEDTLKASSFSPYPLQTHHLERRNE